MNIARAAGWLRRWLYRRFTVPACAVVASPAMSIRRFPELRPEPEAGS